MKIKRDLEVLEIEFKESQTHKFIETEFKILSKFFLPKFYSRWIFVFFELWYILHIATIKHYQSMHVHVQLRKWKHELFQISNPYLLKICLRICKNPINF